MKYTKNIFAVSFIAIMSVAVAHAEIVSDTMLNTRLGTTGNLAKVASTGAYADLSGKPTIPAAANDATLTIQKNGTAVGTFTANAAANKSINITVPTKVTDLTDAGSYATTSAMNTALAGKQATLTTGEGGNLLAGSNVQISKNTSTGAITISATDTKVTVDSALNATSTNPVQNKVINSALSGKQDKSNMATGEYTSGSTTQYPSIKVAETIAKTAAGAAMPTGALAQKDTVATDDIDNNAVTSAKILNGTIAKEDLATAVQTSLGKADTALQAVPVATTSAVGGVKSGGDINVNATTGAVTVTHATSATSATSATKATQDGNGKVIADTYATKTELGGKVASAQGSANAKKVMVTNSTGAVVPAAITSSGSVSVSIADNGAITVSGTDTNTVTTATTTGSGNVVSSVTATNGALTVTKGNVQIPIGSATGTTYATIWVE